MGPEGWIENVYPSQIDNGCVYSSCYGGAGDIIFPGEAIDKALSESMLLKADPGWSVTREIWNEVKGCVESVEAEEALHAPSGEGFFSCKRGVLAEIDTREWEILTDETLDAISAGGLFGKSYKDKSPGASKVILWDEVEGGSDNGARLAGDIRIN